MCQCIFTTSLVSPHGKSVDLHLNKLEFPPPKYALVKKIFKLIKMYFHYFVNISPWKRARPLIWRNLNSFIKGYIVPGLVEISLLVLKKNIFKLLNAFPLFRNYLPSQNGWTLHLYKLGSASKDALCLVWLKKIKNVKSFNKYDTTNNKQIWSKAHLSLRLR